MYVCKAEPQALSEALNALYRNDSFASMNLRKKIKMCCIALRSRKLSA